MTGPEFEKSWRARFENFARHGEDDATIAGWTPTGLEARVRNFTRAFAGDRPGARWLDAGCGAGTYSRYLAGLGLRVVGMDYSHPTLLKARPRSQEVGEWCVADVTKLPVRPGSFDGALCFGVMQALSGPEQAIAELAAAVRPGGEVWVDALNAQFLLTAGTRLAANLRGRTTRLRYDSARQLMDLMRANGLEELRVYWVPIVPGRSLRFLQSLIESAGVRWLVHRLPLLGAWMSHAVVLVGRKRER